MYSKALEERVVEAADVDGFNNPETTMGGSRPVATSRSCSPGAWATQTAEAGMMAAVAHGLTRSIRRAERRALISVTRVSVRKRCNGVKR